DEVWAKGDMCFGIFRDRALLSYGWYSSEPTVTSDGLMITVPRGQLYLYKAFTRPRERGQQLLALVTNLALREYLAADYAACVAYVESNNFSSLRAFSRLGARPIGRVLLVKLGRFSIVRPSRGLVESGFSFGMRGEAGQRAPEAVGAR